MHAWVDPKGMYRAFQGYCIEENDKLIFVQAYFYYSN